MAINAGEIHAQINVTFTYPDNRQETYEVAQLDIPIVFVRQGEESDDETALPLGTEELASMFEGIAQLLRNPSGRGGWRRRGLE